MIVKYFKQGEPLNIEDDLALCVGFFDGLHLGHQKLVTQTISKAKELNIRSALLTFEPDPIKIVKPDAELKHLTSVIDRQQLGEAMGLDYWFVLDFTKETSETEPKAFIEKTIVALRAKHVVVGYDFRFGYRGQGDSQLLVEQAQNRFTVEIIEPVTYMNEKISSTRIKSKLELGQVQDLPNLLGRYYSLKGIIVHGRKKGKELGFPTANLEVDADYLIPKVGVYAGLVHLNDAQYPAMISIGHNTTIDKDLPLSLEAHLIDQSVDLYGKSVRFEFREFLRDQKTFDNLDQLAQQLQLDYELTKSYFNKKLYKY